MVASDERKLLMDDARKLLCRGDSAWSDEEPGRLLREAGRPELADDPGREALSARDRGRAAPAAADDLRRRAGEGGMLARVSMVRSDSEGRDEALRLGVATARESSSIILASSSSKRVDERRESEARLLLRARTSSVCGAAGALAGRRGVAEGVAAGAGRSLSREAAARRAGTAGLRCWRSCSREAAVRRAEAEVGAVRVEERLGAVAVAAGAPLERLSREGLARTEGARAGAGVLAALVDVVELAVEGRGMDERTGSLVGRGRPLGRGGSMTLEGMQPGFRTETLDGHAS